MAGVDRSRLEQLLQEGLSLEAMGRELGRHPATVSYWLSRYELVPVNRERYAARGGLERERLESLVEQRLSTGEIAGAVGRSKTTVRYWLQRYGLKTYRATSKDSSRIADLDGPLEIRRVCRHHGETEFRWAATGYRCKRCRVEAVMRRRRKVKELLVLEAGGCCAVCGYARYIGALEFHHLELREKRHTIGAGGSLALAALREEARKCVLLCSNCHAEIEGGVGQLPATVSAT